MQDCIIEWYQYNKRDLPWRKTQNPYLIWLSEIILQQTRVAQGLPYYHTFISRYPTVFDLAKAEEQAVLRDWQGLGYYSRARNLHTTAKFIVNELNGQFPKTYHELLALKGIGEYTAAAIASFAYNLPHAVLDGNVFRVLSRLYDIETPINTLKAKKEFSALANELLPENQAALFNQAVMEFGALQCVPTNPNCPNCMLVSKCMAFSKKTVPDRPQKEKKTKITTRYFKYLVFQDDEHYILQKRTENDIWKNMYEFPKIESGNFENNLEAKLLLKGLNLEIIKTITLKKHILSHQHIYAVFFIIKQIPEQLPKNFGALLTIPKSDINQYPIPKLIDTFLDSYDKF